MISSISLADVFIFSSVKIVKNCKIFILYLVRFRISAFWNTESGESRTLNCSRRCHFCNFLSQVIPAYSSLKITLLIQPFFIEISEITGTGKYFILQETEFEGMLNQKFEISKSWAVFIFFRGSFESESSNFSPKKRRLKWMYSS